MIAKANNFCKKTNFIRAREHSQRYGKNRQTEQWYANVERVCGRNRHYIDEHLNLKGELRV